MGPRKRLRPESSATQSYSMDYVAHATNRKTAQLVEFKTDMSSLPSNQDAYLSVARKKGVSPLVDAVAKLDRNGDRKQKYVYLLHRFSTRGLELVFRPHNTRLYEKTFPAVLPRWTAAMNQLRIARRYYRGSESRMHSAHPRVRRRQFKRVRF